MLMLVNLTSGDALRWKAKDYQLEGSGSVMCKVSTSKVVSPICVSYGPMCWPLRVSIKRTNHILEI
jgi:hypothetical protein